MRAYSAVGLFRGRCHAVAVLPALLLAASTLDVMGQQQADDGVDLRVADPAYSPGSGPVVAIDEGHHNFHTVEGRYRPFARLLRNDGYVVRGSGFPFTAAAFDSIDIMVIVNALNERNVSDWSLPTPSAFTREEIAAMRGWVEEGGSLLLIADHMPFPGAAEDLAAAFGFRFSNGFALDTTARGTIVFARSRGTLIDHPVTRGRNASERIDSVATFTGQGFEGDTASCPLLVFGPTVVSVIPDVAWQFDSMTVQVPLKGWMQGAVKRFGHGRVAVFGEAAMFTAQRANSVSVGMNAEIAGQNKQFLLNVLHWLSGVIEGERRE